MTRRDGEHADEWVEVDVDTWWDLPDGARRRREWVVGQVLAEGRNFVHRDDLPDRLHRHGFDVDPKETR